MGIRPPKRQLPPPSPRRALPGRRGIPEHRRGGRTPRTSRPVPLARPAPLPGYLLPLSGREENERGSRRRVKGERSPTQHPPGWKHSHLGSARQENSCGECFYLSEPSLGGFLPPRPGSGLWQGRPWGRARGPRPGRRRARARERPGRPRRLLSGCGQGGR